MTEVMAIIPFTPGGGAVSSKSLLKSLRYYNRGYILNFRVLVPILTKRMNEKVKLTHQITPSGSEGNVQIKPNITMSEILLREAIYQNSES